MVKSLVVSVLLLFSLSVAAADRIDRMVWHNKPLPISLPVDKGTTIYLPEGDWAIGIPAGLNGVLEHYETSNILYLTAKAEFNSQLVPVKNIDSGQQILLILSASNDALNIDFGIINGASVEATDAKKAQGKPVDINRMLTRFAAMSLYAPRRLQPTNTQVRPFPVTNKPLQVFNHIQDQNDECIPSEELAAVPIQSWRSANHYVTAIRIENKSNHRIDIDPRGCHIKGDFRTTTAQHHFIEPKFKNNCQYDDDCERTYRDVTTLYLTSTRPFWEVVQK